MPHDKPNKDERDVTEKILAIKSMLLNECQTLGVSPGIRVYPDLYYYDLGQPSRMLELSTGRRTCMRVGLEKRTHSTAGRWGLGWTIFIDGKSVDEGTIASIRIELLRPSLDQALSTYLHLDQAFR
jgi:hypothetical protein